MISKIFLFQLKSGASKRSRIISRGPNTPAQSLVRAVNDESRPAFENNTSSRIDVYPNDPNGFINI